MSSETATIRRRFTVEPTDGMTDCECPESLCTHPDGVRLYRAWTVWDNERDDHAEGTAPEYLRKRDAVAVAAAQNGRGSDDV